MNRVETIKDLLEKYRAIQASLYNQIENVEFATNLLNEQKSKYFRRKSTDKINEIVNDLKDYKIDLSAHAYFIDIKLSILKKELKKDTTSLELLNDVRKSLYNGKTYIDLPQQIKEVVSQYGIEFLNKGKINLQISENNQEDLDLSV